MASAQSDRETVFGGLRGSGYGDCRLGIWGQVFDYHIHCLNPSACAQTKRLTVV
jgi:hypothetical protein